MALDEALPALPVPYEISLGIRDESIRVVYAS